MANDLSRAYTIRTSGDPADINAERIRAEQRMYEDLFRPLEDRLLTYASDRTQADRQAREAGLDLRRAFDTAGASFVRRTGRFGVPATPDQIETARRLSQLDAAAGVTGVRNETRQQVDQEQIDLLGSLGEVGQSIQSNASSGLSSASRMQNARDEAYRSAMSDWRQSLLSSAATGAGAALALGASAGGAALGAGAGLLLALI